MIAPKVVVVDVEVTVTAGRGTPLHDVEVAVHSNVAQRLSVLDHGDGIAPWTLGQSVNVEELKAVAAEAAGVMLCPSVAWPRRVNPLTLSRLSWHATGSSPQAASTLSPQLQFLGRPQIIAMACGWLLPMVTV